MFKKTLAIMLAAVSIFLLCSCSANVSGGGAPTPVGGTTSEWGEDVSVPEVRITRSEAEKVLSELFDIMGKMSNGTLYLSDITYMGSVSEYLKQYNTFDTELGAYMESVRLLLDSYCSLYARNIGTDKVSEQISSYVDGYYGMSEEFRSQYSVMNNADLLSIMNKIELLASIAEES